MKKILSVLILISLIVSLKAQNLQPTVGSQALQQIGSANTMSRTNGVQYPVVGLLLPDYNDTATANTNAYIRLMPGLTIRTGNRYWIRNASATGWNELANASGIGTVTGTVGLNQVVYGAGTSSIQSNANYVIDNSGGVGLGRVGINSTPSTALHITGDLRLVNAAQAKGKTLSTDENGVSTWRALLVNVRDWGALGDGTTDDIAAIRAATLAAGQSGKIFFPNGTYAISDSINSENSGQVFEGYGATIKLLNKRHGFKLRHDSCSVLGFKMVGNGSVNTVSNEGIFVLVQGASYCHVNDNILTSGSSSAIGVIPGASYHGGVRSETETSPNYNEVSGNIIKGLPGSDTSYSTGHSGILINYASLSPCNSNIISNNQIYGNNSFMNGIALIGAGSSNLITTNTVKNCREYGIILYSSDGQPDNAVTKNTIANNIIDSIGSTGTDKGMGMYLQKTVGSIVTGNHISHTTIGATAGSLAQGGITVGHSLNAVISSNIIDSIMTDYPGIFVTSSFFVNIENNIMSDVYIGLRVQSSSNVNSAGNRAISRNSTVYATTGLSSSSNPAGYASIATGKELSFSNNNFSALAGNPFYFEGSSSYPFYFCNVASNTITTAGTGMLGTYIRKSSFTGNIITAASGSGNGIQFNSTNDSLFITDNYINRTSGNFTYGIYSEGIQNTIAWNKIYNSSTLVSSASATLSGIYGNVGIGTTAPATLLSLGLTGTTAGEFSAAGLTSGIISFKPQAAAGTYNFNWPTTAGTSGQVLTSAGGVSSPMTWTTPTTGTGTTNELAYWTSSTAIGALAVATYPSLTEISYVKGVTSAIQTQMNLKAPLASPTFTGTVTIPTPFTLGATSVTSTGTQLNYLNAATGTTGTASTNLVFSGTPTLATPVFTTSAQVPLIIGGTAANDDLTLNGTSNGTTTTSYVNLQTAGGNVGIGTVTPAKLFTINNAVTATDLGLYSTISSTDNRNWMFRVNETAFGDFNIMVGASEGADPTLVKLVINKEGNVTIPTSGASLILGGGATASELRFLEPSGSGTNYSAFKAVAQGASITYSLPPTVGAANSVLTDVAGNATLTWAVPSTPTWQQTLTAGSTLTGSNTITAAGFQQNFIWPTLAGVGMLLQSNSTTAAGDIQTLFTSNLLGANATSTQTTYAIKGINTHTGTASTNVAGYFQAASGTNNYAIIVPSGGGNSGFNTSAPTAIIHIGGGTATVAPEKFTTGTNLTTAEAGAREYNNSFYDTKASGLRYGLGGKIFNSTTTVPNVTTTETDLYTNTLAASTLATDNETIKANYSVTTLGSATATTQNRIYFGGTLIYDSGALGLSLATDFRYVVEILRESSSVVRCSVTSATTTATAAPYTVYTRITGLTLSNTQIIKITGTRSGVGAASGDINSLMSSGYWEAAAGL